MVDRSSIEQWYGKHTRWELQLDPIDSIKTKKTNGVAGLEKIQLCYRDTTSLCRCSGKSPAYNETFIASMELQATSE